MIGRTRPGRSLRLRLTGLAALAMAVTIALGTLVMAFTLARSVRANVDTTLNTYAGSIARSGTGDNWPDPLPAVPGDPGIWAQVVDGHGRVIAATANISGQPALYTLPLAQRTPKATSAAADRGDERVVAQRYVSGTVPVVVYAGGSTRLLSIVTSDLQGHLLLLLPVVVLGAVAVSWLLIGRTLRPVERMRAEAAEITGSDLHRRVPEPGGQDEIGRLARTLNGMLDRLEQSATRQRRFAADASHELRTPLAAIRTSLEVGLAHADKAPWPELAQRAVHETTRLQRLVDALMTLARADDDTLVVHPEPLDLVELARATAAAVPGRVPVAIHADRSVPVLGDPDQLTRLIRNLLDNADRYAESRVHLRVSPEPPGTALLQVADDGPGIPPADRERVFDRFVRLDSARTRPKGPGTGTGLGLSLARDIVTAHGGTITVTGLPAGGPGAAFEVRLPACGEPPGAGERPMLDRR